MDVELLKTFLEVQQTRHFGRAAENLFITQSAVSARIRQLEDELGVRLFMRDRNNIQLTTAGQKLLHHAEAIIAGWNRARLDVAISDDVGQHIAMAAVPNLWTIFIPEWLQLVQQQHTDTAISADALSAEVIIRKILDRALDFGFVFEPPRLPELEIIKVCEFQLILVSSEKGRNVDEALSQNYIYVNWGGDFSHHHARLFSAPPAPGMRIGLGTTALQLLLSGTRGSAYLAKPLVNTALNSKKLHPVSGAPAIDRQVYALYRQDTDRRSVIRELLTLVEQIKTVSYTLADN